MSNYSVVEKRSKSPVKEQDLSRMLKTSSELFRISTVEEKYVEHLNQSNIEMKKMQQTIETLQIEMESLRSMLTHLIEMEQASFLPQITKIQACFRGYLVRRNLKKKGVVFKKHSLLDQPVFHKHATAIQKMWYRS
ncbi:hypothetical protein EDD86DRAFT_49470 [Gorgonomyces haynaldii]|nr:hypothetical protein EDD86DRAFT_49470 [Gorgonomyces haynaldii]